MVCILLLLSLGLEKLEKIFCLNKSSSQDIWKLNTSKEVTPQAIQTSIKRKVFSRSLLFVVVGLIHCIISVIVDSVDLVLCVLIWMRNTNNWFEKTSSTQRFYLKLLIQLFVSFSLTFSRLLQPFTVGKNKYLILCPFRKFSHLQRMEVCKFYHRYISTVRHNLRNKIQKITLFDFFNYLFEFYYTKYLIQ